MERKEKIERLVSSEFAKGTPLPAIRRLAAKKIGGTPDLYLGTVDPVYYRLLGASEPLVRANGDPLLDAKGKATTSTVRSSVRRRRDAGGRLGRWNVLASSLSAALGRKVSEPETKRLYSAAGGDLDASYTGRGTRVGAPATYEVEPVETEATLDA